VCACPSAIAAATAARVGAALRYLKRELDALLEAVEAARLNLERHEMHAVEEVNEVQADRDPHDVPASTNRHHQFEPET
jgi:hypothetical protein